MFFGSDGSVLLMSEYVKRDRGSLPVRICPRCGMASKAGSTKCAACGRPLPEASK